MYATFLFYYLIKVCLQLWFISTIRLRTILRSCAFSANIGFRLDIFSFPASHIFLLLFLQENMQNWLIFMGSQMDFMEPLYNRTTVLGATRINPFIESEGKKILRHFPQSKWCCWNFPKFDDVIHTRLTWRSIGKVISSASISSVDFYTFH